MVTKKSLSGPLTGINPISTAHLTGIVPLGHTLPQRKYRKTISKQHIKTLRKSNHVTLRIEKPNDAALVAFIKHTIKDYRDQDLKKEKRIKHASVHIASTSPKHVINGYTGGSLTKLELRPTAHQHGAYTTRLYYAFQRPEYVVKM